MKLYEGKAAIEKAIANVAKRPAALDKEQHKIALSAIAHYQKHYDTSLIIKWANGVHRKKGNVPVFVETLGIDPDTGKVFERVNICLADLTPWHHKVFNPEQDEWDFEKARDAFIKKAEKNGYKVTIEIE